MSHEQVLVQEPEFFLELLAAPGVGEEAPEEVQVAAAANLMMKMTIPPEAIPHHREETDWGVLEPLAQEHP